MLEKIQGHEDIKNLSQSELNILAKEIRSFLIEKISKTGGHLAANLGVVELTIALFAEFNPYKDRIVWDVGHQAYVHKILSGRAGEFDNLRKFGGLSGFPKGAESDADAFDSGHSSTSVSVATGFAAAAKLNGTDERAIAVIGDGAVTGGMVFEALDHAGSLKLPVIVILNDNGMSISKNVGGLSKRLKKIRTTAKYLNLKSNVKSTLDGIPVVGKPLKNGIKNVKLVARNILLPGMIFEDFGFKYMGPFDGNNIETVRAALRQAKTLTGPVVVHIHTKKGKGYLPAEKHPDYFHGVKSFDEADEIINSKKGVSWSDKFGEKLCEVAENNEKLVAVTAAMPLGTGLSEFAEKFPQRFFDVAIAEQHAVTFAAALAKRGFTPVVAIYSTFLQRAYDQILHDVSLTNQHVVFCIDRCGPVGEDGETHQGMYDIAYMSHIPYMTILSPACENDFDCMLDFAINKAKGPVAVRYPRGVALKHETKELDVFMPRTVKEGTDVLIVSVGTTLYDGIEASKILEESGISAQVTDIRCVKPINEEALKKEAENKKLVVTVEDGTIIGGFGQQAENVLNREVLKLAYPNEPIVQGSVEELKDKYGLSAKHIAERIKEALNK